MHDQSVLRLRAVLLDVPSVVITVVPWQLDKDDTVEGCQCVDDPFSQVVAPASGDSKSRTEQPGTTRSESLTEEGAWAPARPTVVLFRVVAP